jgi:hypothetical protein
MSRPEADPLEGFLSYVEWGKVPSVSGTSIVRLRRRVFGALRYWGFSPPRGW